MNILDIAIAKQLAEGGGGSGTDNYNELSNLPKINDVTLSGNKTASALGLQDEIKEGAEVPSDFIDDTNQDNKFVTSTEKNTWNAKQNAIDADHKLSSDLVDDTNKTNKFVTSTEKNTWNGKQNAIDSDHKLSSSLVSFSTAEANALASGIDSTKVGQIATNQTNILYAINTGVKNLIPMQGTNFSSYQGLSINRTPDGIQISGTATKTFSLLLTGSVIEQQVVSDESKYSIYSKLPNSVTLLGSPDNQEKNRIIVALYQDNTWVYSFSSQTSMPVDLSSYTYNRWYAYIPINVNVTYSGTWKPFLKDSSIADNTFVPGALPNSNLTYLESQDRAALAQEIDAGAKNKFDWHACISTDNLTVTDGVFTTSADTRTTLRFEIQARSSSALVETILAPTDITANGIYYWTFTKKSTFDRLRFGHNGATYNARADIMLSNLDNGTEYVFYVNITQYSNSGGVFKWTDVMICTKAAFGVSNAFVPYRGVTNPTAYIKPTKDSRISSIDSGGYVRIGNLVVVNIRCTVGTAFGAGVNLFTGLPLPVIDSGVSSGAGVIICTTNRTNLVITTVGSIANVDSAEIPTGLLEISAVYLCQ